MSGPVGGDDALPSPAFDVRWHVAGPAREDPPLRDQIRDRLLHLWARIREFAIKYERMLWWLHSLYAFGLGLAIIAFAQQGFAHARWLTISLATVWIAVIVFFRIFGAGKQQAVDDNPRAKMLFYVMTYVLKNLYQGMLFFLLPFYWRTAVQGTATQAFVVLLAACAVLSTLDVVFDRVLMRSKLAASLFYFLTLFCCLNLVIPSLFPNTRSLVTLIAAAVVSALALWTMHVPFRLLHRLEVVALLVLWTTGTPALAYFGRRAVPPAAMHLERGAVGPRVLDDGRLAIEASAIHESLVTEDLWAVTDVYVPGGKGDRLVHVWRRDDRVVQRSIDVDAEPHGTVGTVRLRSKLARDNIPSDIVGHWLVDVETEDSQLIGRVHFDVIE